MVIFLGRWPDFAWRTMARVFKCWNRRFWRVTKRRCRLSHLVRPISGPCDGDSCWSAAGLSPTFAWRAIARVFSSVFAAAAICLELFRFCNLQRWKKFKFASFSIVLAWPRDMTRKPQEYDLGRSSRAQLKSSYLREFSLPPGEFFGFYRVTFDSPISLSTRWNGREQTSGSSSLPSSWRVRETWE